MLDDEYYSIYSIEWGLGIISSRDFPVKRPSVKFAALLTDRKRRFAASLDYTKPVKRLGFLAGFRLYFRIKAKLWGLTDDEIHAHILKSLADPESLNNDSH